jgi:hypothetical protein
MGNKKQMKPAVCVICSVFLLFCFCQNPFSLEQRMPPKGSTLHALSSQSPEDVFINLETAYNSQDLYAFMSLLSDDFVFAVNKSFEPEKPGTKARLKSADLDSDGELEYFWNRDWEEQNHKRIFNAAKRISLTLSPPDSSEWWPWVNPSNTQETLGIYIRIDNINLKLTTQNDKIWWLGSTSQKYGLKKDPADTTLWLIGEWHDEN